MASGFAPEFLILLGIDIFLGSSILTVLLDRHFPPAFPYVLDAAALIGFAELMAGPTFLVSLSAELQFYYSFAYAMISVLTLMATNLYLLFLRRRPFESAIVGLFGTIPSGLGILYFTSAFVNGLALSLPIVPVIPISGVYAMFGMSIALVVFSLVVFGRRMRSVVKPTEAQERLLEPFISRASPESSQVLLVQRPSTLEAPGDTAPGVGTQPTGPSPTSERDTRDREHPQPGPGSAKLGGAPKGGMTAAPSDQIGLHGEPARAPKEEKGDLQNVGTVLVKRVENAEYRKGLVESIRFFEKAVDRPVRIDPKLLGGTVKGATKAYLTPAGMLMVEDSKGKMISLSLMDISTDEALQVMREAMKGLKGSGDPQ